MTVRSTWAAVATTVLILAACRSVHTQTATSTPSFDQPVSLTPGSDPAPGATAIPVPAAPNPPPAKVVKHSYNNVEGVGRTIAITFDDGPSPKLTPALLDMLKQRGIKATFFVVGQNAAEYPDILKRMVAEGHEIGNHSWSHPALNRLSASGVAAQIEKTNAAVRAATGKEMVVMRPPYGATNAALDRRFNEQWGQKVIIWDVDPLDWKYRNAARVQSAILSQTKPGSIILVHDIHPTSVAAMPGTLDGLLAKGYKFATVSELIAMGGSVPAATPVPLATPVATPPVIVAPVVGPTP